MAALIVTSHARFLLVTSVGATAFDAPLRQQVANTHGDAVQPPSADRQHRGRPRSWPGCSGAWCFSRTLVKVDSSVHEPILLLTNRVCCRIGPAWEQWSMPARCHRHSRHSDDASAGAGN